MRVAGILLLVGAAFAASPEVEKFREQRIIGGSVTTIGQYPSMVALIRAPTGTVFTQACGAVIITNRSCLTAAHCFDAQPGNHQWRSRVGSTNANSGGTVLNTQSIIIHPHYNRGTADNDFAVIRWVGTVNWSSNIQQASIAGVNYNLQDNQVVWATGWGNTAINGWAPSEQLRHVQIWTVNQAVCRQRYATRNLWISDNMLCSGWLDVGGRDQCQGDSGGPLYHNNVVVGICSWGLGCADPFFPGVNARVSSQSTWIVNNA